MLPPCWLPALRGARGAARGRICPWPGATWIVRAKNRCNRHSGWRLPRLMYPPGWLAQAAVPTNALPAVDSCRARGSPYRWPGCWKWCYSHQWLCPESFTFAVPPVVCAEQSSVFGRSWHPHRGSSLSCDKLDWNMRRRDPACVCGEAARRILHCCPSRSLQWEWYERRRGSLSC